MAGHRILMGVVGRPHGVQGLVRVHSYAAEDLAAYSPLLDEAGRAWTLAWRGQGIAELRDDQGRALAGRTAAERLVNTRLYVERERLPAPEENVFYLSDLVGLRAVTPQGAILGRVGVVHDYGAGASLEIAGDGSPLLVPFTKHCVPQIDPQAGTLTVVLPDEIDPARLPEEGRGEGEGRSSDATLPQPAPGLGLEPGAAR